MPLYPFVREATRNIGSGRPGQLIFTQFRLLGPIRFDALKRQ
jgi:hypothetical protein